MGFGFVIPKSLWFHSLGHKESLYPHVVITMCDSLQWHRSRQLLFVESQREAACMTMGMTCPGSPRDTAKGNMRVGLIYTSWYDCVVLVDELCAAIFS